MDDSDADMLGFVVSLVGMAISMPAVHLEQRPCDCGPQYHIDHSEFGLPLGYDMRCEQCGAWWKQ